MKLLRAIVVSLALIGSGAAFAPDPAEPAGPPLSDAPRRFLAPAPPKAADADAATYQRCMKLAQEDPLAARVLAESWEGRGGAHPADHCLAVALIGLKQYKEAA